jgi:hypothetical protein
MRWLLVIGVLAMAGSARAGGDACSTSAECGALRCIEGVCRDPKTAGIHVSESQAAGRKLMFGDERGYGAQILVADLAALATIPLIMGVTYAADNAPNHANWGPNLLAMIPPSVTGSFVHAMHKRLVPALVSFFGWASVVGTSAGLGLIFGITPGTGCMCPAPDNTMRGWLVGGIIGSVGATLMTSLDVYMARSPKHVVVDREGLRVAPYAVPTPSGGTLGVVGRF